MDTKNSRERVKAETLEETLRVRQQILQSILYGAAVFGTLLMILFLAVESQKLGDIFIFYGAFYAALLLATFVPRLGYTLRVSLLMGVMYLFALIELFRYGLSGNGGITLLTFSFLASALAGIAAGYWALGLSILTLLFFTVGMPAGWIPPPSPDNMMISTRFAEWLSSDMVFVIMAAALLSVGKIFYNHMQLRLLRQRRLTIQLEDERHALETRAAVHTSDLRHQIAERQMVEQALRQSEEHFKHLSTHDALTGLYNRMFFENEIARQRSAGRYPFSVLMIDVDGLKVINDSQGHAAGDEMLRRVGQVVHQALRSGDMVARIGGDEFCVLLPETSLLHASRVKERIFDAVQEHNAAQPSTALQLSIGGATAENPADLDECLRKADKAMYQDKLNRSHSR